MARTRSRGPQDLIGRISDTIADHPRVSAAAAFQMGVLLGQTIQYSGALKGIGRRMAAAQGAIASSLPTFGLLHDENAREKPVRTTRRSPAKRRKRTARG